MGTKSLKSGEVNVPSVPVSMMFLVVLILSVCLRVYYLQCIPTNSDEIIYYRMTEIFEKGSYTIHTRNIDYMVNSKITQEFTPHYPPLYPLFIYLLNKIIVTDDFLTPSIVSLIFGVLTVLNMFVIGCLLHDRWTGITASLFTALNPLHINYTVRPLSESTMLFFLTLSVVFLMLYLKKEKKPFLIFTFLSLALVPLTHVGDVIFVICVLIWGIAHKKTRNVFIFTSFIFGVVLFSALLFKFKIAHLVFSLRLEEITHKVFSLLLEYLSVRRIFGPGYYMFGEYPGIAAYLLFLSTGYAANYVGVLVKMAVFPLVVPSVFVYSIYLSIKKGDEIIKLYARLFVIIFVFYILFRSCLLFRDVRYVFPVIFLSFPLLDLLLRKAFSAPPVRIVFILFALILPFYLSIGTISWPAKYAHMTWEEKIALERLLENNAVVITNRPWFVDTYLKRPYISKSILHNHRMRLGEAESIIESFLEKGIPVYFLIDYYGRKSVKVYPEPFSFVLIDIIGEFNLYRVVLPEKK